MGSSVSSCKKVVKSDSTDEEMQTADYKQAHTVTDPIETSSEESGERKDQFGADEPQSNLSEAQIVDLTTTCIQPTLSPELNDLFVKEYSTNKLHIEYKGFLSNHLADCMIAQNNMKYHLSTIRKYMEWYNERRQLEDPADFASDPLESLDLSQIIQFRGSRTNYYGIYKMMEYALENTYNNDLASFINDRFPVVSGGIAGALIHPVCIE